MLSQLEADMNSSKAIIQDHDLRIKELKTNRTAGRESIINLETEIANLEANLTSVSTIIKTQGEFLISMNETLIQMGAVNEQSSTSLKAYMERQLVQLEIEFKNRLLKIESNATTNRKDIEVKYLNITDKMTLLETNVLSQMGKSENLSSNLANLEFDIGTITATLHINHDDIVEINEKIRHLNDTLTDSFDMAQYLISNITYLELEIGAMKAEIQNNSHGIVSAVANFQELDKSTSDSISRLDTGLTDITDALNCTWSDWEPFSMCSKSCGGGTKYRTRRCESTMPLNQRWLQRTETDIQLCNSYTCSAIKSAFTVKEVADGPGGTTIFTKYITNIGGHYDTSTGRFTCQYSGIYLFSLNILKDESEPSAFCYISVNGELQAGATSNPRATGGYLGSSNTVIFHLYHGDVIELDICTSAKTMTKDNKTTFSGVLLQAD